MTPKGNPSQSQGLILLPALLQAESERSPGTAVHLDFYGWNRGSRGLEGLHSDPPGWGMGFPLAAAPLAMGRWKEGRGLHPPSHAVSALSTLGAQPWAGSGPFPSQRRL